MDLGDLHAGRRLVEQQQFGVRRQSPGDLEAPHVGEGERARQVTAAVGQANEVQQPPRSIPEMALDAPALRRPQKRGDEADALAPMSADHDVLEHGHAPPQLEVLEGPGQTAVAARRR